MRSFASRPGLLAAALVLVAAAVAGRVTFAQSTPAAGLFADAQTLESTLRKDVGAYRAGAPSLPLLRRARILVGTYEDIARLFPDGGQAEKALLQGVTLAADVFDLFKDGADRAAAVRLAEALDAKYPASPQARDAQRRISALALDAPAAASPDPLPSVALTPAPPTPSRSATPTVLRSIRRETLPDVLRVSLELDREVAFHEERLDGPPRVFVDLPNTRAADGVLDARLAFDDDVVRQIRVGRQIDRRVRVVLDLSDAPVHSVYTLYNPFRIVIDFERSRPAGAIAAAQAPAPAPTATAAVVPAPSARATVQVPAVEPVISVARRELVLTAPPPARTPGGLSVSRQLGLGLARVVIDPGHGGHDPGAKQGAITEAELVLDVAFRLEQLLQKEGFEVILTRRSNVYVSLEERPALAMREEADLYISIHANASADARVRGVETYVLNFAPNAASAAVAARENAGSSRTMRNLPDIVRTIALNNKIDESRDLARQVQATLVERLSKVNASVKNLGVKQAPFAVLVGADMPSILTEIGFITNKQDLALVRTAVYRQRVAEALADGIARYHKRLKPSQVAVTGK